MKSPAQLPLRLYGRAVERGARWPLGMARMRATSDRPRVGYYLWRFPSLTGTYICREVGALRQAGLDVEVFADVCERDELLDGEARAFADGTHYLLPLDPARLTGPAVASISSPTPDGRPRHPSQTRELPC